MKRNIYDYKNYMGIAMNLLNKIQADAEDAIQNALLLYLKYKDRLNTENPEKTISWLIRQECIRIYRKNNNITSGSNGKIEHGKFINIEYIQFGLDNYKLLSKDDPRRRMLLNPIYSSFNEGPDNFDMKVLLNDKNALNQYFTMRLIKPNFKFTATKKKNGHCSLAVNGEYMKTFKL